MAIKNVILKLFGLVILSLLLVACATNIVGRQQLSLIPESEAIVASKEAYLTTLKPLDEKGLVDKNPKMVQRVNEITSRLIQQAGKKRPETQEWDWSVKVIEDPDTVNAWCMAGGKMAIYSGLIEKLDATDDEIAQVMGHEISHALANHSAERMSVAMASGLAVKTINQATGNEYSSVAALAAQLAITLPNSRLSESEADRIGIELAAKAGYDPHAAVTLWQKMAAVSGGSGLEFLSTHPSPGNREQALKQLIPKMLPYYQAARTGR